MPSDSIHIAPVITTDTLSPILSDSNRIISDSLRTTHPEWDLHYKKDSVKFTPQYAESLSAYCYAPIDNPLIAANNNGKPQKERLPCLLKTMNRK